MKKIKGEFYNKSITSIDQFSRQDVELVLEQAAHYKYGVSNGSVYDELSGKILTALFYEPSSRTFGSFITAMQRLGGGIIPIQGVKFSSVSKGETLEDTIRTFASFSDAIALRHPEKGASEKAAKVSPVPIINAGDGVGEHPSQALLDAFTIQDRLGRLENLTIAMVGDLKYGRTVHSLAKVLSYFSGITIYFVAPDASPMPKSIVSVLNKRGVKTKAASSIDEIVKIVDVLYMTRVQKERMESSLYESIKNMYILKGPMARRMKKESIIMHPFPRVNELDPAIDANPRASYLTDQMPNGMFVRMALLKKVLNQ